jgi:hypothetical protein
MITYNTTVPSTIGELSIDVVIDHTANLESETTDNPVETGWTVSDHVIREPLKLAMTAIITPTPISYFNTFGGANLDRMSEAAAYLMQLWKQGEPITITLPDAIYDNMLMTRCPLARNVENGFCYRLALEFKHITFVDQKTEEIPEANASGDAVGKAGETGKDAGTAAQVDIGTGVTFKSNTAEIDTTKIDLRNFGNIATGVELTAARATYSLLASRGILDAAKFLNARGFL